MQEKDIFFFVQNSGVYIKAFGGLSSIIKKNSLMSVADNVVPGKVSRVYPRHSYHGDIATWSYLGYSHFL